MSTNVPEKFSSEDNTFTFRFFNCSHTTSVKARSVCIVNQPSTSHRTISHKEVKNNGMIDSNALDYNISCRRGLWELTAKVCRSEECFHMAAVSPASDAWTSSHPDWRGRVPEMGVGRGHDARMGDKMNTQQTIKFQLLYLRQRESVFSLLLGVYSSTRSQLVLLF